MSVSLLSRAGFALLAIVGICASCSATELINAYPVDPLVKVFRKSPPTTDTVALAEVARGEHAAFQIVTCSTMPLTRLHCTVKPLTLDGGHGKASIAPRPTRFVGYVPVDHPVATTGSGWLRTPDHSFPDPLLEQETIDVAPGDNQPIWITVKVPLNATPGTYSGNAVISANCGNQELTTSVPLKLRVFSVKVDKTRLFVTNWFQMGHHIAPIERFSPEYWARLRQYAHNMADHRQNCFRTEPLTLAQFRFTDTTGTSFTVDFSRLDRWIRTFIDEGLDGKIEGLQIGSRAKGWNSQYLASTIQLRDGVTTEIRVAADSPEAEAFYAQYLPALEKHLEKQGWLDRYVQRIADEPIALNAGSYRTIANYVRKYAPRMKISDASLTEEVVGSIDIWVPRLEQFGHKQSFFDQRRNAGEQIWFYTCCDPRGPYANRFIEQPLMKTRLLHWINYRYNASGFLHWGYNFWTPSPYTNTTDLRPSTRLPAGDTCIVYPSANGVIDSIRWEAMRDGIVDHELLSRLAEKDRPAADDLAARHIKGFAEYDIDIPAFRATRHELLEQLSR